jgi:hypothetical protein
MKTQAREGRARCPGPLLNPYLELFRILEPLPDETRLAARKKLIWAYSWAVPSEEAMRALAELSPLVELGCGTGYWAWLLAQAGAQVTALDREPAQAPRWVDISAGDERSLSHFASSTLLLCWPPLGESMATQAVLEHGGSRLALVGEWRGRTADERFHDVLDRDWVLDRRIALPCWPGYSDELRLFSRK